MRGYGTPWWSPFPGRFALPSEDAWKNRAFVFLKGGVRVTIPSIGAHDVRRLYGYRAGRGIALRHDGMASPSTRPDPPRAPPERWSVSQEAELNPPSMAVRSDFDRAHCAESTTAPGFHRGAWSREGPV